MKVVAGRKRATRTPLDARRLLTPRDYAVEPHLFGERYDVTFRTPPDGDAVSRRIAEFFHRLVVASRHHRLPSGAEIGRRFGFSRQTWSNVTRGHRWPSHTVLIALLVVLEDAISQPDNN